jgi:hypothetical protein
MSIRKTFLIISLFSLLALLVGCSSKTVEPESNVEQPNLNDEFGGYMAVNESPGFGDEMLVNDAYGEDQEYDDPMLSDSSVDSVVRDINAGHFHMRIVWGRLRYDSTSTTPTDWTGSLTINYGAEVLRRVIRFEPNQDYILPRDDRRVIEWVSKTTVHHDGIAVDIFVPPIKPIFDTTEVEVTDSLGNTHIGIVVDTTWPERDPVTVSFETGPFSHTFNLEDLVSLDRIVYLDDSNAVAFHAFKLDRHPCPRGFLSGAWGFNDAGQGVFRGMWMDDRGFVIGYLKGHFGRNDAGNRVFFGKWISRDGRFEGFIKGRWGYSNCTTDNILSPCHPGGYFVGLIYNGDRQEIGALGGQFRVGFSESDRPGGYFQGRWKIYCPDEPIITLNVEEGFD